MATALPLVPQQASAATLKKRKLSTVMETSPPRVLSSFPNGQTGNQDPSHFFLSKSPVAEGCFLFWQFPGTGYIQIKLE